MARASDTFLQLGGDSLQAVRGVQALLASLRATSASASASSSSSSSSSSRARGTEPSTGDAALLTRAVGAFAENAPISPATVLTSTLGELASAVALAFPSVAAALRDGDPQLGRRDGGGEQGIQSGSAPCNAIPRNHGRDDGAGDAASAGDTCVGDTGAGDKAHLGERAGPAAGPELHRLSVLGAEQNNDAAFRLLVKQAQAVSAVGSMSSPLITWEHLAIGYEAACQHGSAAVLDVLNAAAWDAQLSREGSGEPGSVLLSVFQRPRRPFHLVCACGSEEAMLAAMRHPAFAPALACKHDISRMTALHHAARGGAGTKVLARLMALPNSSDTNAARGADAMWGAADADADVQESGCGHAKGRGRARAAKGGGGRRDTKGAAVGDVCLQARDAWGRCPLHWAVVNGHRTAVNALLTAGADANASDAANETPLEIAQRRAQCRATDRGGLRPSVFGDIATLLGGSGKTVKLAKAKK